MNDSNSTEMAFRRELLIDPDPQAWADAPVLVLTACDSGYLSYAIALARSMEAFSGSHHLMIHVVNPGEDDIARLELLAESLHAITLHVSSERVSLPEGQDEKAYYASARFLRMAELLESEGAVPLFALDADALALNPLTLDFSDKPEVEICLRRRDLVGPVEDHLRVAAGAVWAKNSSAAAAFMKAVADELTQYFREGSADWFIDQLILGRHVLAGTGGAQVRNMKPRFSDWDMSGSAVFWTGKGDRKYRDVRYLLMQEAFEEDPVRREAARQLHARFDALVPEERHSEIGGRLRQALEKSRGIRVAIYLPRLDLPWKRTGMRVDGRASVPSDDTVELRLWWKRFTMELARTLTNRGVEPAIIEIPAWEITPERVDGEDVDLAFVPHRCKLDFGATRTRRLFYMQEYFRSAFVVDQDGWSAASSVYPVAAETLPPAVLGAWDHYRDRFVAGALESKFGQAAPADREHLVAQGSIPKRPFIFHPLQIPTDQSIRYFSDVDQDRAMQAVMELSRATGLPLVLKEHPANRVSMRPYRDRYPSQDVTWSEAHVHDLLRHCVGVVTINSGVGFEALLAGKPVVCLGRSEYDTTAYFSDVDGLRQAWDAALAEPIEDRMRRYGRFVDWFLGRHAVDIARPVAAGYVLDRIVGQALLEIQQKMDMEA
ncbi:MAG: hypothetical protein QM769_07545 [Pseudoxanthomonas sp.]